MDKHVIVGVLCNTIYLRNILRALALFSYSLAPTLLAFLCSFRWTRHVTFPVGLLGISFTNAIPSLLKC
jgi:hypothetical protein